MAETDEAERAPANGGFSKKRLLPLFALAAATALFFGFGLHEHLTFESLRDNRESLLAWVEGNRVLAAALFAGLYAVVIVFIPPSGTIMTVAGGFIFGSVLATAYTVCSTAVGIIPGTFVYALVGNGLGSVFDAGGTPDLGVIFKPEILAPIVDLAILSLVPVAYKKIKARNAGAGTGGGT